MPKRPVPKRRATPIRLIPYATSQSLIAVHGSLAVALDSDPPPTPRRRLDVVRDQPAMSPGPGTAPDAPEPGAGNPPTRRTADHTMASTHATNSRVRATGDRSPYANTPRAAETRARHGRARRDEEPSASPPTKHRHIGLPDAQRPRYARPPGIRMAPPGDGRPGVRAEARLIAQLVLEVLTGRRPYHQLAGRTTSEVFEMLDSLAARMPGVAAPRLRRLRICEPKPGVAEVAVVAAIGPRAQALALRLVHDRGRWRCAAIETTVPS